MDRSLVGRKKAADVESIAEDMMFPHNRRISLGMVSVHWKQNASLAGDRKLDLNGRKSSILVLEPVQSTDPLRFARSLSLSLTHRSLTAAAVPVISQQWGWCLAFARM